MLEAQELGEEPSHTVGSYLTDWLSHMRGRVRPKTFQGYQGLIWLYALPRLGHIALARLSPLDLQRLYAELLAPRAATCRGERSSICTWC